MAKVHYIIIQWFYTQYAFLLPSFDPAYTESSHLDSSRSLEKAQKPQKSLSLPKRLPSNDPILVALRHNKESDDGRPDSVPTSPDDISSTSTSEGPTSPLHEEYRSPLSGEKGQQFSWLEAERWEGRQPLPYTEPEIRPSIVSRGKAVR